MDIKLEVLRFALGFVPGAAPFLQVFDKFRPAIEAALPILQAGLPKAKELMDKGAQGVAAFQSAHPKLLDTIRQLATAITGDDAAEMSDAQVVAFASPLIGRPWTAEDQQRWFDKASGVA